MDTGKLKPLALPQLQQELTWEVDPEARRTMTAVITGTTGVRNTVLGLTRQRDGFSWDITYVAPEYPTCEDYTMIENWKFNAGIAFEATPQTAIYPWKAPSTTKAAGLSLTLRKQRSKSFKRTMKHNLQSVLEQLQRRTKDSTWKSAAMQQHPRQLWNRQGLFTDYQNWTMYRLTLGALNLRHQAWPEEQGCSEQTCTCPIETADHIIWECTKAKVAWKTWVDRCLDHPSTLDEREGPHEALATRQASATGTKFLELAQQCFSRWMPDHDAAMSTLWPK